MLIGLNELLSRIESNLSAAIVWQEMNSNCTAGNEKIDARGMTLFLDQRSTPTSFHEYAAGSLRG
jgi:hypothetical protein